MANRKESCSRSQGHQNWNVLLQFLVGGLKDTVIAIPGYFEPGPSRGLEVDIDPMSAVKRLSFSSKMVQVVRRCFAFFGWTTAVWTD